MTQNFQVLPSWKYLGELWNHCTYEERSCILAKIFMSLSFPIDKTWNELTFTDKYNLHRALFPRDYEKK